MQVTDSHKDRGARHRRPLQQVTDCYKVVVLAVLVVLLAGCGGGSSRPAKPRACRNVAAQRALKRLQADVRAIRRAAALPTKNSRLGNPQVNRATDAFLRDVATAPIGNLARNRLIDHAAAALTGSCEQCFQALEAERPIPAISHAGRCG
jgi:hypothetical protein